MAKLGSTSEGVLLVVQNDTESLCQAFKDFRGKSRRLLKYFAADLYAGQIAEFAGLNRSTVDRYLKATEYV